MPNGAIAGGAGGAVAGGVGGAIGGYHVIANAVKASGAIVRVEPNVFEQLIQKQQDGLIIFNEGGIFSTNYKYLMSYKGIFFFTKTKTPLVLPANLEVVKTKKIWMPE